MKWFQSSKQKNDEDKETSSAEGDRYAVNRAISAVESALDASASSRSSYVSIGTSFESDDSVEVDELFDDEELDELMGLETNPIMGGWVDSACGWLDKPMCFMQFGKETSLLRQSKGRTKSAIQQMRISEAISTAANMKLSAAERSNLRLHRKGLPTVEEGEDVISTISSQYISAQRIQPLKKDAKIKEKKAEKQLSRDEQERTRSTVQQTRINDSIPTAANMKSSASERRNLRLHRKGLSKVEEGDDLLSTNSSQYLSAKQIHRLRKDTKLREKKSEKERSLDEETTSSVSTKATATKGATTTSLVAAEAKHNVSPRKSKAIGVKISIASSEDRVSKRDEELNKGEGGEGLHEAKSRDPDGSHHKRAMSDDCQHNVERTTKDIDGEDDGELSRTLEKALMDTPDEDVEVRHNVDDAMPIPELDVPVSVSIKTGLENGEEQLGSVKSTETAQHMNSSARSERSLKIPIRKNTIMDVMQRSQSAPRSRSQEITILTHLKAAASDPLDKELPNKKSSSVQKPIEIIDVLSMDDQDSWTPGVSAMDSATSGTDRQFEYHGMQHHRTRSKSRDPSPSLSRRNGSRHGRDPSPSQNGRKTLRLAMNADDIWNEEEAKLINQQNAKGNSILTKHKPISPVQAADDVWTEEEQKLQGAENIFDDPEAREAFLGHRRGRLQDAGPQGHQRTASQSRRRRLVQADDGGVEEDAESSRRSTRSRSLDLPKAPTPEVKSPLKPSRSKSRERRNTSRDFGGDQDDLLDQRSSQLRVNKSRDLVAVRTIEDGQRLRSQKHSNSEETIDVYEYRERSVSRGRRGQPRSSSIRSSKGREVVDLAHLDDYQTRRSIPISCSKDARDDHESRPEVSSKRGLSKSQKSSSDWPDYETVVSATKELRKLERKIEKQLRQVKRDSKSKDEWESHTVSSKEIKKLEKQLTQKLMRDSEKRATKLKRIKRKGPKPSSHSSGLEDLIKSQPPSGTIKQYSEGDPESETLGATASKSFSQKVDDFRERSKFDQLTVRSLRSARYLRSSSRGARTGTESPEAGD